MIYMKKKIKKQKMNHIKKLNLNLQLKNVKFQKNYQVMNFYLRKLIFQKIKIIINKNIIILIQKKLSQN